MNKKSTKIMGRPTLPVLDGFCRPIRKPVYHKYFVPPVDLMCVYVLLKKRKIIYVGFSRNLYGRLKQHSTRGYTHFIYREGGYEESLRLEHRMIIEHKPSDNMWQHTANKAEPFTT